MIAIPNVSLDDPPTADKFAVRRRAYADAANSSRGGRQGEGTPVALASSKLGLLLSGDWRDPAEGFFDPLADALADSVAGVAHRAPVERPLVFRATCGVPFIARTVR
jgi:hypothetical protein